MGNRLFGAIPKAFGLEAATPIFCFMNAMTIKEFEFGYFNRFLRSLRSVEMTVLIGSPGMTVVRFPFDFAQG